MTSSTPRPLPTYEQIRAALLALFTDRGLTFELVFWVPDDWNRQGWRVLQDAALVLSFEGSPLVSALEDDPDLVDALTKTLASLECWYEQGHSWNLGVYRRAEVGELDPEAIVALNEA